jgi:polyhydroxybutyrate depolymerase
MYRIPRRRTAQEASGMTHHSITRAATALLAAMLVAGCIAGEAGSGRERLRERLAARAGERIAARAPAARRLWPGEQISAPGRYEIRLRHGGRDRMALVHVPRSWDAATAAPMVLALHGGGGGAIHQADDSNYGLISKADQAGFIAVFPNGIGPARSGMLATWNAGDCCARARDENVDDVGFLRRVIEDVKQRIRIDAARVYAIGMSNGAMMSYRLACEAADVIRGIMAVAGTDNTRECHPSRPVPVLHIHAQDDDRVLFGGGAGAAFRSEARVTSFTSVPDTIRKWARLNGAASVPRRVLDVAGAWCDLHEAGTGGAPVKLCVTRAGGHSWPGGSKARGGNPSTAIRANDLMWEFFSAL